MDLSLGLPNNHHATPPIHIYIINRPLGIHICVSPQLLLYNHPPIPPYITLHIHIFIHTHIYPHSHPHTYIYIHIYITHTCQPKYMYRHRPPNFKPNMKKEKFFFFLLPNLCIIVFSRKFFTLIKQKYLIAKYQSLTHRII